MRGESVCFMSVFHLKSVYVRLEIVLMRYGIVVYLSTQQRED